MEETNIRNPGSGRLKFSLRSFLLIPVIVTFLCVLFSLATIGCISSDAFLSVHEEMSQAQVTKVLGKPYKTESRKDGHAWIYRSWGFGQSRFVEFDENGSVIFIWS